VAYLFESILILDIWIVRVALSIGEEEVGRFGTINDDFDLFTQQVYHEQHEASEMRWIRWLKIVTMKISPQKRLMAVLSGADLKNQSFHKKSKMYAVESLAQQLREKQAGLNFRSRRVK
jgi:hypothetical protein